MIEGRIVLAVIKDLRTEKMGGGQVRVLEEIF